MYFYTIHTHTHKHKQTHTRKWCTFTHTRTHTHKKMMYFYTYTHTPTHTPPPHTHTHTPPNSHTKYLWRFSVFRIAIFSLHRNMTFFINDTVLSWLIFSRIIACSAAFWSFGTWMEFLWTLVVLWRTRYSFFQPLGRRSLPWAKSTFAFAALQILWMKTITFCSIRCT